MSDLIDRAEAIQAIMAQEVVDKSVTKRILMQISSAEPEHKTGKWMISPDGSEGICTSCQYRIYGWPYQGNYLIVPHNYCPNCGAKMEV